MAAGVVGVAITAVAAGTAVILSDKKRRKKVEKVLSQLGKTGKEWVEKAQTTLTNAGENLQRVNNEIQGESRKKNTAKA